MRRRGARRRGTRALRVSPPRLGVPAAAAVTGERDGGAGGGQNDVAGSKPPPSGATDVAGAVSGAGVEGVLGGVCAFAVFVCIGACVHGRERRKYRATERDVAAQHAKMERAVARREEELARGERNAVANRAKQARVLHAGDERSAPGDGGGGRRGGVTRGAFEPRRPGGDDEEPERDGMEDDEVPEGVYDAPAAPRDSAWSLAAGVTGVTSRLTRIPPPPPPLGFGARGWDAARLAGSDAVAGAAAAAGRAAEGARGGLYAGGGGATRETMNAPPLGPSGALPVAVTPRDGSDERPAPVPVIVTRRRRRR